MIDDAAKFATRGQNWAAAAASAVNVDGGLNVLPGGNGVQTWQTVTASAAAAVAVGPNATAFAQAGAGGAQAAAGAGGNVFVPGNVPGNTGIVPPNVGGGVVRPPQGNTNLMLDGVGKILEGLGELLQGISGVPVSPPTPHDCGGLKADAQAGTVTTDGGYTIKATGKFSWEITGPDGKCTKIDGDPHVHGKSNFDFKKDATFVLGDGTRINVKTKDYGNGATVTDKLEIEKGGQVVDVNGIAEGKGQVGQVRQGKADFATGETFVEGAESNTWSFNGKEILGSNGADNFKLGGDLAPANAQAQGGAQAAAGAGGAQGGGAAQPAAGGLGPVAQQGQQLAQNGGLAQILNQVLQVLTSLIGLLGNRPQPAPAPAPAPEPQRPTPQPAPLPRPPVDQGRGDELRNIFGALGGMFIALGKVLELSASVGQPRALNA
ncbi:MAG TPA: DUF1521 domain-containing protein [Myxococcaceae bacterium]|nr:DUF1521 domain-containing protein [Myxococcaceae bacterium]